MTSLTESPTTGAQANAPAVRFPRWVSSVPA